METGYGFVFLRGAKLSPGAEVFKESVWAVENDIAAKEGSPEPAGGLRRDAGIL